MAPGSPRFSPLNPAESIDVLTNHEFGPLQYPQYDPGNAESRITRSLPQFPDDADALHASAPAVFFGCVYRPEGSIETATVVDGKAAHVTIPFNVFTCTREIVASTSEAAYATDVKGHIIAWNKAAERLLGFDAHRAVGERCHRIIRGTDLFGNRFCDEKCALSGMARRGEPVNAFKLDVGTADSRRIRVEVSVLLSSSTDAEVNIVHILTPVQPAKHTRDLRGSVRVFREPIEPLTPRESEVLAAISDGMKTHEVAEHLCISVETVRNHVKHIFFKLDVHSRIEAILLNRRIGIT